MAVMVTCWQWNDGLQKAAFTSGRSTTPPGAEINPSLSVESRASRLVAKTKGCAMSQHKGPTIDDLLADSLIRVVMRADHVEPEALKALLNGAAGRIAAGRRQHTAQRVEATSLGSRDSLAASCQAMTYFDSELIQVMQNALEEVMTRVPSEYSNQTIKTYLAHCMLIDADRGRTSYSELVAAGTDQIQMAISLFPEHVR